MLSIAKGKVGVGPDTDREAATLVLLTQRFLTRSVGRFQSDWNVARRGLLGVCVSTTILTDEAEVLSVRALWSEANIGPSSIRLRFAVDWDLEGSWSAEVGSKFSRSLWKLVCFWRYHQITVS